MAARPGGWAYRVLYPSAALLFDGRSERAAFRTPVVAGPRTVHLVRAAHEELTAGLDPLAGHSRLAWALEAVIQRPGALPSPPPLLVYTVIEIGLPWLLLSDAERHVESSFTGLVIAGVPLVAAVLARLTDRAERLTAGRVGGLLAGFAGVALLLGFHAAGGGAVPILELAGVVVCYAAGPLIIERRLSDVPRYGVAAASLVVGALLAEVGGVRATVITFVNPAVAVVLGALVLDESVTWLTGVAFALILAGSVLSTLRRPASVPAPAPAA